MKPKKGFRDWICKIDGEEDTDQSIPKTWEDFVSKMSYGWAMGHAQLWKNCLYSNEAMSANILSAFAWAGTPQGALFWSRIQDGKAKSKDMKEARRFLKFLLEYFEYET